MHTNRPLYRIALAALLAAALAACGKQEAPAPVPAPAPAPAPVAAPVVQAAPMGVAVAGIELGTAANPNRIAKGAAAEFAANDKINAVVNTTGTAAAATLVAKWTYQDGQTVNESTQTIAPSGPASTTFTIEKADGWPLGKYKVEITLDGQPAGSSEFEIK